MARAYVKRIRCDEGRAFHATVGATAVVRGQLVKFSGALLVTLADDDKQLDVLVCLATGAVSDSIPVIPLRFVDELEITYIGSAPTVGAAYAVEDGVTLDQADTTNKLLIVNSVDTGLVTCMVRGYQLSS